MWGVALKKPDNWIDQSMLAFKASETPNSGIAPNIVITQDSFSQEDQGEHSERIKSYANRVVAEMEEQLPGLVIHTRKLIWLHEKAAAEILISWRSGSNHLTQWLVFINRDEHQVIVSTATTAQKEFSQHEETFRNLLNTIEL